MLAHAVPQVSAFFYCRLVLHPRKSYFHDALIRVITRSHCYDGFSVEQISSPSAHAPPWCNSRCHSHSTLTTLPPPARLLLTRSSALAKPTSCFAPSPNSIDPALTRFLLFTDTSHVPCKFFRQGACQAGTACPFSHDLGAASETVCKYFAKVRCVPLLIHPPCWAALGCVWLGCVGWVEALSNDPSDLRLLWCYGAQQQDRYPARAVRHRDSILHILTALLSTG